MENEFNLATTNPDLISPSVEIVLSPLSTFTEQKVATAVKELYREYVPAEPESVKTIEQVVDYIANREMTHSNTISGQVASVVKTRAAVNACRWDLGKFIDTAMQNHDFGHEVAQKVADVLALTVADIYAYRNVYLRTTRVEAYVMGLFGFTFSRVMQIASIVDDDKRKQIIETACGHNLDLKDVRAISRNNARVLNAIKTALLPTAATIDVGEEDAEVAEESTASEPLDVVPEELHKMLHILEKLKKDLKPFRNARTEADNEVLTTVDIGRFDMGNQKVEQLFGQCAAILPELARDLNDVEDYLRQYRESIDALLCLVGDNNEASAEHSVSDSGE